MYYLIRHSLDIHIMGHYPQVREVLYDCDIWEDPRFVDRFVFDQIPEDASVGRPILHSSANLTDLIYLWDMGFVFKLLISGKLKAIIERYAHGGVQFVPCSVFQDGMEYADYWLWHMYEFGDHLIDFTSSMVSVREKKPGGGTSLKIANHVQSFSSYEELVKKHELKMEVVKIEPVVFKADADRDLLKLRNGGGFVVSEQVKYEIISAGCTGIEFQPSDLSFNEWFKSGGEREQIYGKA